MSSAGDPPHPGGSKKGKHCAMDSPITTQEQSLIPAWWQSIAHCQHTQDEIDPNRSKCVELDEESARLREMLDKTCDDNPGAANGEIDTENDIDEDDDCEDEDSEESPSINLIQYYAQHEFPWNDDLEETVKEKFGITRFRAHQKCIINVTMDGRDIIASMPTGTGKSLLFQAPALVEHGKLTLVIEPLVALIHDQIKHLDDVDVRAVSLTSRTDIDKEVDIENELREIAANTNTDIEWEAFDHPVKLVYITPEKLELSQRFFEILTELAKAKKIGKLFTRFVIDEAQCISDEGLYRSSNGYPRGTRPAYRNLGVLRTHFPDVPILALTATFREKVIKDIQSSLNLPEISGEMPSLESGTLYVSYPERRTNVRYEVWRKPRVAAEAADTIASWILTQHKRESGIIYCTSRREAAELAATLKRLGDGQIVVEAYHADIEGEKKQEIHARWHAASPSFIQASSQLLLIFSPVNQFPRSMDDYLQMIGRAGRDGEPAVCVLFFRPQDVAKIAFSIHNIRDSAEGVREMLRYTLDLQECRRVQIARHLPGSVLPDACLNNCDNCLQLSGSPGEVDVTTPARQILQVTRQLCELKIRTTMYKLAEFMIAGDKHNRFRVPKDFALTQDETEYVILRMLMHDYLQERYAENIGCRSQIVMYIIPGRSSPHLDSSDAVVLHRPNYHLFKSHTLTRLWRYQPPKGGRASPAGREIAEYEVIDIVGAVDCRRHRKYIVHWNDQVQFSQEPFENVNDCVALDRWIAGGGDDDASEVSCDDCNFERLEAEEDIAEDPPVLQNKKKRKRQLEQKQYRESDSVELMLPEELGNGRHKRARGDQEQLVNRQVVDLTSLSDSE
ncbi:ATP-dependent DNA helicase [Fistulina hepatica ATCC 64428]|uniref:ATP-dependent DNA helicase n=1 Tax=Fistulina hepatica ATCC 64428 TaxID=1128425 RepID=A0A0D7AFL1_9AGAR|nr:ATP-dependent DNA helicase [Fistulina hepatica ATCC 64428]